VLTNVKGELVFFFIDFISIITILLYCILYLGRTGPGVCYRLYSEDEFEAMAEYSTPELQKVPLDALLLQMVAMGLPNARLFPFIEPPQAENVENAIESLKQHVS